jgi:hypothetical protein
VPVDETNQPIESLLSVHRHDGRTLGIGYAQMPEPTIRAGVRELAEVVRATRNPKSRHPDLTFETSCK